MPIFINTDKLLSNDNRNVNKYGAHTNILFIIQNILLPNYSRKMAILYIIYFE